MKGPVPIATACGLLAAVALAAAAAAVTLAYRRDMARAYARIGAGSERLATPWGDIEYTLAGSGAPVLVNGRAATVAGRVSMDMTAIDVTDLPDARVGDTVVLWGVGVPAESVAPYADTIAYELVCGLTKRVTVEWQD